MPELSAVEDGFDALESRVKPEKDANEKVIGETEQVSYR